MILDISFIKWFTLSNIAFYSLFEKTKNFKNNQKLITSPKVGEIPVSGCYKGYSLIIYLEIIKKSNSDIEI